MSKKRGKKTAKNTHGGRRAGAGRKPKYDAGRAIAVGISVSPALWQRVRDRAEEMDITYSAVVIAALEHYFATNTPQEASEKV